MVEEVDRIIKEIDRRIEDELQKSYDETTALHDENTKLRKEIERLKKDNVRYNRSRKMDSSNSSLPPSVDNKRKVSNSREKSDRTRGGQLGHPAHLSRLTVIVKKTVNKAPTGAMAVMDENNQILYYKTQEIDATIATYITETRYYIEANAKACDSQEMKCYAINGVSFKEKIQLKP